MKLGEKNEKWASLRDIEIPEQYLWIWSHFLTIWQNCERDAFGNVVFTFRTINDYVECMKPNLTIQDKKVLLKMKNWASETIYELSHKDED